LRNKLPRRHRNSPLLPSVRKNVSASVPHRPRNRSPLKTERDRVKAQAARSAANWQAELAERRQREQEAKQEAARLKQEVERERLEAREAEAEQHAAEARRRAAEDRRRAADARQRAAEAAAEEERRAGEARRRAADVMPNVPAPSCKAAPAPAPAPIGQFGERDFTQIVDASRNNELRFNRDYNQRVFATTRSFKSVATSTFGLGSQYAVTFTRPGSGDLICFVAKDDPAIGSIIDWRKGQVADIRGTISTTMLGALQLKNCTITARQANR
jgi:hypothetical protein